ncbi:hypothetical protein KKC13_05200 [bacterium]|nr:hypothetical protein [bacterium]MBU1959384.1 hypothetical protein [bacterium]
MFGEFEEMIFYHAVLLKLMLAVLVVGLIIPFLSSDCAKTVKRTRIYMFVSHGTLSMIAFSGLIAFVFADMSMTLSIAVMIVAFFAMIMLEVVKYKKILKDRTNSERCMKNARVTAVVYTLLNIAIIAGLVVYKIMEAKSAVPVS